MTRSQNRNSVSTVLNSIERSDPESVSDLWSSCFPRLVTLAHATLRHLPHRVEDAQDAAQSALFSFWQRLENSGIESTLDRNSLWCLLATITARKAKQLVRREFAQKRGVGGVVPFTDLNDQDSGLRVSQLLTDVSTADFDLSCEERLRQLPEELRPFAMLRLFSHTNAEISQILECSERKVERKLSLIRSYWSTQD